MDKKKKLTAQTYDGTAVMSGKQKGLQAKMKVKCPEAIFVHCYAHKFKSCVLSIIQFHKKC